MRCAVYAAAAAARAAYPPGKGRLEVEGVKGGPKLGPVPRPKVLGGDGGTANDRNECPGAPSRAVSDDIRLATYQ